MEFRMNCQGFLEKTTKKIMDKSPIKYSLIRNMSCLNPRFLATDREAALSKMKSILKYLAGIHLLRGGMDACDDLMREFTEFVDTVVAANIASFKSFDHQAKDSQVDTFLHGNKPSLQEDMGPSGKQAAAAITWAGKRREGFLNQQRD